MRIKAVVPRERALLDIDEATAWYLGEGAQQAALGFVDALEEAFTCIARHAATGSARYAQALDLPDLRFWPLKRFPHLVFYFEHADHIDVWRVLHGLRDIPVWIREAGSGD